jgi:hypothetical protein
MTTPMEYKRLILIHSVATALVALAGFALGGVHQALSVLLGSALLSLSVGFMAWSIGRILAKKSVALASGVIVIKYLILGVVLYWMTLQTWISLPWIGAGVVTVLITSVFYSLTTKDEQ